MNHTTQTPAPLRRALFIDRDGTIIREPADEQIDSLEKLEFVPGAISALRSLAGKGFDLVMVSNQDGLGTPSFPEETFHPAHNKMLSILAGEDVVFDNQLIDRSFPADNLPTRKPGTAMLTAYTGGSYDLARSYVIGDRLTDLQLAANLGARGIILADAATLPEDAPPCALATTDWHEIARHILNEGRRASRSRKTSETDISLTVDLDGHGPSAIDTGLNFLDHMLWQLPHHAGIALTLVCRGDLHVDEHHTMEDVAIVLGGAILEALGNKQGIERYGFTLPMDECDATVRLDLGGRIDFKWNVPFTREYVGDTPTEMFSHFFQSLCCAMNANLHVEARGVNNHHLAEGVFKAFARALRMAIRRDPADRSLPSSKGSL